MAILRSVITVTALAPGASVNVAHGLVDALGAGLAPHSVIPLVATPIVVTGAGTVNVAFANQGEANETCQFLCLREHSIQAPASTAQALWAGGAASLPTAAYGLVGNIDDVTVGDPGSAGVSALVARADHQHEFTALSNQTPAITVGAVFKDGYASFEAALAADPDAVSTVLQIADGNSVLLPGAVLDYPRQVSLTFTDLGAAAAVTAGTLTINGVNTSGGFPQFVIDMLTLPGLTTPALPFTLLLDTALLEVTRVNIAGLVGGADIGMEVGITASLGLPVSSDIAGAVVVQRCYASAGPGASLAVEAGVLVGNNCYTPTTAPDATAHHAVRYSYPTQQTATQAAHTHTN